MFVYNDVRPQPTEVCVNGKETKILFIIKTIIR